MRKVELLLVLLILASMIGNLIWLGYFSTLFLISGTLLSILYFALGFALFNNVRFRNLRTPGSFQDIGAGKIASAVALGLALSIITIGILFKFLLFQGANEMLTVGNIFLLLMGVILTLLVLIKQNWKNYAGLFKRIIPALILGLLAYLIPAETLINVQYRNYPTYADLLNRSMSNPYDTAIQEELQSERQIIFGEE